mmetsp:Transcript_3226/g.5068  ORF Transcript_3226/g.5068 Transcript_3226/m.5068 type:complete len:326 (+) Transcript_3226:374-1351(+)
MCAYDLNKMMPSLVIFCCSVGTCVQGIEVLVIFWNLLQNTLYFARSLFQRFAKRQMVDDVCQIRHRRIEVVIFRFRFNMEISRDAVDHQMSRHLTTRMIGPASQLSCRGAVHRFNCSILLRHFKLTLRKSHQRRNSSVLLIIRRDRLSILKPSQCRKCPNIHFATKIHLSNTIHSCNSNLQPLIFRLLCEFLPRRMKTLTPHTPGSIKVNKSSLANFQKLINRLSRKRDGMNTIRVQIIQTLRMLLMRHLTHLPIASTKNSSHTLRIQLPFFNIFGDILTVGAQSIQYIHADVIAVQIHHGHVKVQSHLSFRVIIQRYARDYIGR